MLSYHGEKNSAARQAHPVSHLGNTYSVSANASAAALIVMTMYHLKSPPFAHLEYPMMMELSLIYRKTHLASSLGLKIMTEALPQYI